MRWSTQSWPSIVVGVVFLQVRLSSASGIEKDCPGGPLCVPHGQTSLTNECNYNPRYALMRSQWCQDNRIHYKVWADIFMMLKEARVFRDAKGWGSDTMKHEFADEDTMFLLENLITVDLFASTVIALNNKGNLRTDKQELGAFPIAKWLTKRCIDVETFLAHYKSLRDVYGPDDAILPAKTAVTQMANNDCYTTKAHLNCKYAGVGVDCAKAPAAKPNEEKPSSMPDSMWRSMGEACRKILSGCKEYKYKKEGGREECSCISGGGGFTFLGMGIIPLVLVCCGCVCVPMIAVVVFVFFRKPQQSNQARASLMSPGHLQQMPVVPHASLVSPGHVQQMSEPDVELVRPGPVEQA